MHSVRLEPTKLILIGTRTTYQATGAAPRHASVFSTEYNLVVLSSYIPGVSTFYTDVCVVYQLRLLRSLIVNIHLHGHKMSKCTPGVM